MPTHLPRTQVTHTARVQRALEVAGAQWPDERPAALLLHLIDRGARSLEQEARQADATHQRRVAELAGAYSDDFDPELLTALRREWDE